LKLGACFYPYFSSSVYAPEYKGGLYLQPVELDLTNGCGDLCCVLVPSIVWMNFTFLRKTAVRRCSCNFVQ